MSRSEYEKALELVEDLHPAAHVLAKAQQKIRDPNVEINDLEKLLRTDPSITSDIIRLSNSAYYSYSTPSKDLSTSISRIGLQELLKLVGLSVSKSLFAQDLMHYNMAAMEYWSESISTALLMESLAKLMSEEHQEAYTIGLLSCVGKIVINQVLEIFGEDSIYDGTTAFYEWEKSILGFDSAFAGAMILKRWEFPADITNAVLHQFKAEKAEDPTPVLHALSFTRKMIAQAGYGFTNDNIELDSEMEEFLARYFIDEEELVNSIVEASENFEIIKSELDVH